MAESSVISSLLTQHQSQLLTDWMADLVKAGLRRDRLGEAEIREECQQFIGLLQKALLTSGASDVNTAGYEPVKAFLAQVSRSRGLQGFSPSETATFVFSLKQPLFNLLRKESKSEQGLADELWRVSSLLDKLGLFTTEAYQKTREELITRQQQEMLELSTPVVTLWKGILALPVIGTLDSTRTQTMMEALLQRIVETESDVAILDITGVPTVDTLTAQHLIKTVTATRLMGADCIISGVRPQIAQTIVHLGVNLGNITTKSTLAAAFQLALQRLGATITVSKKPLAAASPSTGRE